MVPVLDFVLDPKLQPVVEDFLHKALLLILNPLLSATPVGAFLSISAFHELIYEAALSRDSQAHRAVVTLPKSVKVHKTLLATILCTLTTSPTARRVSVLSLGVRRQRSHAKSAVRIARLLRRHAIGNAAPIGTSVTCQSYDWARLRLPLRIGQMLITTVVLLQGLLHMPLRNTMGFADMGCCFPGGGNRVGGRRCS